MSKRELVQCELEERTFVVFAIAGYHLALPIETVLQVISHPLISENELSKVGLIQVGQYLIQVIDLYQCLEADTVDQPCRSQSFLIVIAGTEKNLHGILVDEPPNLMKLPLNKVQCLPPSDRQFPLLNLVSHMVVRDQTENPAAIFLLNTDKF